MGYYYPDDYYYGKTMIFGVHRDDAAGGTGRFGTSVVHEASRHRRQSDGLILPWNPEARLLARQRRTSGDGDGPALMDQEERARIVRSLKQQQRQARNRTRTDSPREQRRRCRARQTCRGRNWCPDMDVGNRAFLAPTVFEGKARSMSSARAPGSNYAVTFEVRQVYKSQPGFLPLQKNDSVRLHFRDKAAPGKSTMCSSQESYYNNEDGSSAMSSSGGSAGRGASRQEQQQRDNSAGVVRANIKRGKVYLVFVNRVGPRNFTILGEPVIRSKKNEQAVQAVIRPDYGEYIVFLLSFFNFRCGRSR